MSQGSWTPVAVFVAVSSYAAAFAAFVASASVVVAWTYWSNYRARRNAPPPWDPFVDTIGGNSLLLEKDGPLVVFFADKGDDHVYDDALLVELGLDLWLRLEGESAHGPGRDWDDYETP